MKFISSLFLSLFLLAPFKFLFKPHNTVIERTTSSIIKITGFREIDGGIQDFVCTGFVVAPKTVLTAAHCLGDRMLADGIPMKVEKFDHYYDLALVRTSTLKKPLKLRTYSVWQGEPLTGVGYGYGWDLPLILAQTVVLPNYAIEPDAAVGIIVQGGYIGGMSGGPVIDSEGQVVGIIQRSKANVGYGVGSQLIRAFLLDCRIEL